MRGVSPVSPNLHRQRRKAARGINSFNWRLIRRKFQQRSLREQLFQRHAHLQPRQRSARTNVDGTRILVDRLWPRGLTKAKAALDLWLKEIAPSTELRKWFGHDPNKWTEFKNRYRAELKKNDEPLTLLKNEMEKGAVTLVYGAKDEEHNEAVVLQEFLNR